MTRDEYDAISLLSARQGSMDVRLNTIEDRTARMETEMGHLRAGIDKVNHHVFDGNGKPSLVTSLHDLHAEVGSVRSSLDTITQRLDLQQRDDADVRRARIMGWFALGTAVVGALVTAAANLTAAGGG